MMDAFALRLIRACAGTGAMFLSVLGLSADNLVHAAVWLLVAVVATALLTAKLRDVTANPTPPEPGDT